MKLGKLATFLWNNNPRNVLSIVVSLHASTGDLSRRHKSRFDAPPGLAVRMATNSTTTHKPSKLANCTYLLTYLLTSLSSLCRFYSLITIYIYTVILFIVKLKHLSLNFAVLRKVRGLHRESKQVQYLPLHVSPKRPKSVVKHPIAVSTKRLSLKCPVIRTCCRLNIHRPRRTDGRTERRLTIA